MHRRQLWVAVGLLAPAPIVGCSLVYSYEDVRQPTLEEPDSSSGNDATAGPDVSSIDAGGGGDDGGPSDASTTTPEAEAGPLPAAGAVVIGGVGTGPDGGLDYVLSVLDPKSGHELSRERMAVVGVAYDGQLDRDLWYIFETLNPGIV